MKKNYFKKIAALVAAASLCTVSFASVSAATNANGPMYYEIEDKEVLVGSESTVTLDVLFSSKDKKTFDSFGGFAVVIDKLPEGFSYLGRTDNSDLKIEATSTKADGVEEMFVMSAGNSNLKDGITMTTLKFGVDWDKVKVGDEATVRFRLASNVMTSNSLTGEKYGADDKISQYFENVDENTFAGSIKIVAPTPETTTAATTTVVTTTTTVATTTTAAATTTAATTAATTAGTSVSATKTTTTVASAPKTGESTDGIAALAATIVAAAGAAVVLRKKKD